MTTGVSSCKRQCGAARAAVQVCLVVVTSLIALDEISKVSGFHISLGQKLLKSMATPQVIMANSLIKPLECKNLNNQTETGICMFSIDCMQSKGVPLSVCKHNYFVGTCCKLPNSSEFAAARETTTQHATTQLPATTTTRLDVSRLSSTSASKPSSIETTQSVAQEQTEVMSRSTGSSLKADERYIISSMSLFPSTQTMQTSTTRAQLHSTTSRESARNADGMVSSGPHQPEKNTLVVSSESLTSQPPTSLPSTVSNTTSSDLKLKKNEYEVIKEEASYDLPTTLSSAHSPSSTQQQFNVIDHSYPQPEPDHKQHGLQKQQNNVYLLDDSQKSQQNVVFANNHQQLPVALKSSTGAPKPTTQQVQTAQDQQVIPYHPQDELKPLSSTTVESTPQTSQTVPLPSTSSLLFASHSPPTSSQSSPSTHLDLVSTSDLTQSTTPFTTSLSTAILPNITSHAYSPTEQPPNTSMLVSSSHSTTPTGSSKKPLAQLYNGQPPEIEIPSPSSRPLFGPGSLIASTKLVGPSSSSNQFIPGLAGLQSALLSHIPFKLATGLTSYLQAAMKPVGGRPLISSNTAPALQYQQHLANATRPPSTLSNIVKFPGSSSSASSQASSIISSFSDSTPPMQQPHGPGNSLIISAASKVANSSATPYDAFRETQLVCGRPQVQPGDTRKRVGRIVGGNQSMFGQWPWMVSLRQWRKGAFLHKCGAALLNEKWAITAAHCVESVKASDLLLRLGEFDVSNQEEPYPYIERRVKTVVAHPSFDPKTFEYDLALLKFAEPVKYERNIVPVCVPSGNDSYVDRMATVIGWGRLYEDGPLPDVIQHVDVPIITNKECEKMYKNAGYIEEIPEMFICAGISKGGRDSCEGDSGGPLTMVDHDGRSYLVGIISWGIGCALPSQPGVYTRITAFSGWINQIIDF